jgi:hypothetical protein
MVREVSAEMTKDQTLFAGTTDDRCATFSAAEDQRQCAEVEIRNAGFATVAAPTIGFKDRDNVAFKRRSGRGSSIGRSSRRRAADPASQREDRRRSPRGQTPHFQPSSDQHTLM